MPKKVSDPKNKLSDFLTEELIPMIQAAINCHIVGRVISYDKSRHVCDVQPLPLQSDKDKRAALTECVVPASIWQTDEAMVALKAPDYKKMKVGSVVWIGYCDREMDNWTGSSNYQLESKRMHSLQDPVVEAVINP